MANFSFGATPTTTTAGLSLPAFGTPQASAAPSQISFGTPGASTGFSFGQTPSNAAAALPKPVGFSFGTPAAQQPATTTTPTTTLLPTPAVATVQPQFGFGQQAASNTQQSTTSAAALSFGVPPAAPTSTTTSQSGFSFGGSSQATVIPTTTSAPSFNFGASATTATTSLTLNPVVSTTTTNQVFGQTAPAPLFGVNAAPSNQQQPATTTAPPAFTGLGGIDMSATQQKIPEGKIESTKVKETQVPPQVIQSVEEFKTYVKNQKTISSEITRSSDRKLKTVVEEIQRLNCVLQESSNNIDNNRSAIKHLRNETAKVIENADMAQRTHETPSGLQFENVMPQIYFKELIQRYENDLLNLKHQVELTEKHLQSIANPQNFTADDLKQGLQQIHESFIALAGRLQEAHQKVENQKTQYLELRKFVLRDSTNVFEVEEKNAEDKLQTSRIQYGPNAFSNSASGHNLLNFAAFQKGSQQQQQQQQPLQLMPIQQQQQSTSTNLFGQPSSSTSFNFGFNK